MDPQNQTIMNKNTKNLEFVKKMTKFILSFSVFSFIFVHFFITHFTNLPSLLILYATDKNYIFLLCNGILVFIAKYSTRIQSDPPPPPETSSTLHHNDSFFDKNNENLHPEGLALGTKVVDIASNDIIVDEEKEEVKYMIERGGENDQTTIMGMREETYRENDQFQTKEIREDDEADDEKSDDEEEEDEDDECMQIVPRNESDVEEEFEEEEEEEGGMAKMSTEELNRKFDDFIRKMKEDLRIEAQRQLIMV